MILVILFSGAAAKHCTGQIALEEDLTNLFKTNDTAVQDFLSPLKEAQSEFSTIAAVGFFIYKSIISSQDNPSCVFTPSCSEYAVQSIQHSGLIIGWLKTFDRLSRCHGLVNHHHYPLDVEKRRYYDPVQ